MILANGDMIIYILHGHLNIDESVLFKDLLEVMHSSCLNHMPSKKLDSISSLNGLEFSTE